MIQQQQPALSNGADSVNVSGTGSRSNNIMNKQQYTQLQGFVAADLQNMSGFEQHKGSKTTPASGLSQA